jgi:hypothetical protein
MEAGVEPRVTPMTLISPIPRWWGRFERIIGWLNMRALNRGWSYYPFRQLVKLSFIQFAHWSVFDRIPPGDPHGRRLPHAYLVFQTNFNRGAREYIEAFSYVVPTGMRFNWSGAYGFPSPRPVSRLLDYVEPRFTKANHFYCAYPDASTRQVISALDARRAFNRFAAAGREAPERFLDDVPSSRRGRPLGGKSKERTETISVLSPIIAGHEEKLRRLLDDLPDGLDSPLGNVSGTHMARWSIVAPLPFKKSGKTVGSTSYLLFTSWFEGSTSAYTRALRSQLGKLADEIWGNCHGYPDRSDLGAFWSYLIRHSMRPHLAFGGYPDSVSEVQAALQLQDQLTPTVVKQSGLNTVELERARRAERRRRRFR